jgi:hypothetical protein
VEVLAALVVTMLLVLAFTPFAGQLLATLPRGTEVARLVDLKTRGIGRLRDDLRHAIVWAGFGESEKLATFRGAETWISFAAATGLGPGGSGLEMLSITVDTSSDGRALVRRRASLVGTTFGSFQDPVVLFSGPFRYVFRYYAQDGRELPIWDNRIELPARIRLTIADFRGAVLVAPIELPTFASLSAGCLVSANLPGCPVQPKEDANEWMRQQGLIPDEQ